VTGGQSRDSDQPQSDQWYELGRGEISDTTWNWSNL